MMTGMELRHLKTFLAAAEQRNFTRAAEQLEITQAAVSQHVAALEDHFGEALFERGGRQVTLTPAGRSLSGYARQILELLAAADKDIAGVSRVVSGTLRIASSSVPAEWLLPDLLAGFRGKYSQVRETIVVSNSRTATTAVESGDADVGLVGELPRSDRLSVRPLAEDELVLVVSADHELAGSSVISAKQLVSLPLIVRGVGSGSQRCVEESLESVGIARADLSIWMETNSADAVRSAILRGLGAAFLSRGAVAEELKSGRLVQVPVRKLSARRQLYLVSQDDRVSGSPLREFLEFAESWSPG